MPNEQARAVDRKVLRTVFPTGGVPMLAHVPYSGSETEITATTSGILVEYIWTQSHTAIRKAL